MDRLANNLPMSDQSYRRIEVLTGTERRRIWSLEEKTRIVAESISPGVIASHVARRNGVHPNQLYTWRRELRNASAHEAAADFVPISVGADCGNAVALEIDLSGAVVRAVPGIDLDFLSDVLRVVKALA